MTNNSKVQWYGDELIKRIMSHADDALFEGGELLITDAAAGAPKDSGTLRDSGYVSAKGRSTYRKDKQHKRERKPKHEGVVAAGFAAFYSHMIEHGTSRTRAQPFLRPALDRMKGRMGKAIVSAWRGKLK
jgi:HK97 gp10 family phage protein